MVALRDPNQRDRRTPAIRNVQVECLVQTPPPQVIAAFLEREALQAWWHVERAFVEPHVGGVYALAWGITDRGFGYVTTAIVSALDPAGLLRLDHYTYFHPDRAILGPMVLTIEATPHDEGGSRMRVTQEGYQDGADWDWYYEAVREAWPRVGQDIVRYLNATR